MTDALKPCPFCGDAPYTDEETAAIMGNRTGHRFAIACRNCEISASGASDMPAAIAAWNTRADLATPQPAVKVKALVWEERRNGYWQAVGTGYQIAHNQGDVYRVRLGDKVICRRISGFENAKHWVFARHSAAILSALEPATRLDDPRVLALVEAGKAVVDRWDSPLWKDLPHTGESIDDLRAALSALEENK